MAEEQFLLLIREAPACSIGFKFGCIDLADIVVRRILMGNNQPADAGLGNHGAGIGQADARPRKGRKYVALEAMVRAAGIAYAGAYQLDPFRQKGFPLPSEVL